MTTATVEESWSIPEELAENSFTSAYRVLSAGAARPPARRAAKIIEQNRTPQLELHICYEPLDFKYNSDRAKGFEDDFEHTWCPIYDKNGDPVKAGSNLDFVKKAFAKLGYNITNQASAAALVGKVFALKNEKITRVFKKSQLNPDTGEVETVDDPQDSYVFLPIEQMAEDYAHVGPMKTFDRPRNKTATATAASTADNILEALPMLRETLNGLAESEYFMALVNSKNPVINRSPYIVEAQAGEPLTRRMLEAGMKVVDGKLVS